MLILFFRGLLVPTQTHALSVHGGLVNFITNLTGGKFLQSYMASQSKNLCPPLHSIKPSQGQGDFVSTADPKKLYDE